MKVLDYEGLKQVVNKIKGLIDKKADKVDLELETIKINDELNSMEKRIGINLEGRLKQLESAVYEDITGNPFTITFSDINSLELTNGIFNENKARLEC